MVSSVLLTAALAAGAVAAPSSSVPGHRKGGGFSAPQVRSSSYVRHGPSAMAKTLIKFGKTVPDDLAATIKAFKAERRLMMMKRSNGSAVTTPEQYDTEYLTPVQIGTPAQTLNLDFDSGSSDLWVFSSETKSSEVAGQSTYNPSNSSTSSKLTGQTWSITYGDGSASSGDVYTDLVNVGGVSFSSQAVESAQTVSTSFTSDANNDGLLGLAFSTLNTVTPTAQKTFFDNIRANLDSSLWTADLKYQKPGTYNFGFIDSSLYTGSIAYTTVDTSDGFWTFTADSWAVGTSNSTTSTGSVNSGASTTTTPTSPTSSTGASQGGQGQGNGRGGGNGGNGQGSSSKSVFGGIFGRSPKKHSSSSTSSSTTSAGKATTSSGSTSSTTLTGIADTGTTLALLPTSVCESYYSAVSGATYSNSVGGYIFSCDATLPSFTYTVGSVDITIPGEYLNYSPIDTAGTQCYGGIQPDSSIGFSIFGDVALKSAFVVFKDDGSATPQLGFAAKTTV